MHDAPKSSAPAHRFLMTTPLGIPALDIKEIYRDRTGSSWRATRTSKRSEKLKASPHGGHHALGDAEAQRDFRTYIKKNSWGSCTRCLRIMFRDLSRTVCVV